MTTKARLLKVLRSPLHSVLSSACLLVLSGVRLPSSLLDFSNSNIKTKTKISLRRDASNSAKYKA